MKRSVLTSKGWIIISQFYWVNLCHCFNPDDKNRKVNHKSFIVNFDVLKFCCASGKQERSKQVWVRVTPNTDLSVDGEIKPSVSQWLSSQKCLCVRKKTGNVANLRFRDIQTTCSILLRSFSLMKILFSSTQINAPEPGAVRTVNLHFRFILGSPNTELMLQRKREARIH